VEEKERVGGRRDKNLGMYDTLSVRDTVRTEHKGAYCRVQETSLRQRWSRTGGKKGGKYKRRSLDEIRTELRGIPKKGVSGSGAAGIANAKG